MKPGAEFFAEIIGGEDPARVSEAADRAANLLVRGARDADDPAVAERVLHLAETEGIETIAEVWAGSPADSLAGCLWRLFVLRSWVYADPATVAREYDAGRRTAQVAQVVAGVADPPGPDELRTMVDEVLRGIAGSDFADVLFRAAAFARVVATGRAALDDATEARRSKWRGCWCWPSSSRRPVTRSSRTASPERLAEPEWRMPDRERLHGAWPLGAAAAPGPETSRSERPRAREALPVRHARFSSCPVGSRRDVVRARGRRRAGPRRGRVGLGALRGRPEPGQGPAGAADRRKEIDGVDCWAGLMLTSKDHDRDAEDEARHGRHWMDIGTGAWDPERRPSEVRLDRLIVLRRRRDPARGCRGRREVFDRVVAEAQALPRRQAEALTEASGRLSVAGG